MVLSTFTCEAFNVDFMRFSANYVSNLDILEKKCSNLDVDNSNFLKTWFEDWEFVITAVESGKKKYFLLRPINFNFEIARFYFDEVVWIDLYSSFFYWEDWERFLKLFLDVPHKFSRVDICMDLEGCTPLQLSKYFDTSLPVHRIHNDQTIYFGDWKSNRKIVRIYDKKLDTIKKRKTELYPHLLKNDKPVTRIEIELRNKACERWSLTIQKLLDPLFQYKIFKHELSTKHIFLPLPDFSYDWFKPLTFERGLPNPVLRFDEAIHKANLKNVDILDRVLLYLTR